MPDWVLDEAAETGDELAALRAENSVIREDYADLANLYSEDVGWRKIGAQAQLFTPEGRKKMAAVADLTITGNALIKRGFALRVGYVWGQGVAVQISDDGEAGQDVNAVWQDFCDDQSNREAFVSSEAQVAYERRLATGGEAFFALPTEPITGKVHIRRIAPHQIVDRITDPEDEGTVWFYKRVYTARVVNAGTGVASSQERTVLYPALGFYPPQRPTSYGGDTIRWDAPVRHVAVNVPDEDWRGTGDVLAALPWARMDKEFLEDLSVYMRALTRIIGQATAKNKAMAGRVQEALASVPQPGPGQAGSSGAGNWAVTDPNTTMSILSKSGAQIDADSSKPFAARAASALEVPVTMLISDPGTTGARATAETLDQPTENMARLRREIHNGLFRDLAGYVIDQALLAPAGPLRGGLITRYGDRLKIELPEGDSRTVEVAWPDFDSTPLKDRIASIVDAATTETLPPVVVLKLLAAALEIPDVDELLEDLTDADGNWIGFATSAGDAATTRFNQGDDPAKDYTGDNPAPEPPPAVA